MNDSFRVQVLDGAAKGEEEGQHVAVGEEPAFSGLTGQPDLFSCFRS